MLEKHEFEDLKKRFDKFDPLMKATLRVATIVSSVDFDDIENAKKIPVVQALFDAYPGKLAQQRITGYLQSALSPRRHYLQMLNTGGNANMFRELSQAVGKEASAQNNTIFGCVIGPLKSLGLWGTLKNMDHMSLTHNTYKAMKALEKSLQLLSTDNPPTCEALLDHYLDERGRFLAASTRYTSKSIRQASN